MTSTDETAHSDETDSAQNEASVVATLPSATTMKAVVVKKYAKLGEDDGTVDFSTTAPKPTLSNKPRSKNMMIRVLACSISPADTMMTKGALLDKRKLPFIPGNHVCGTVEAVDPGVTQFRVGDTVVANANGIFKSGGGMAEYLVINETRAILKPEKVDVVDAASCFSAVAPLHAIDHVKLGDRVLILGDGACAGPYSIALCKLAGASFIATTCTDETLCKSLGADMVINDNAFEWWETQELQGEKLNKIIDTLGGSWLDKASKVLEPRHNGGLYISMEPEDTPTSNSPSSEASKSAGAKAPLRKTKSVVSVAEIPRQLRRVASSRSNLAHARLESHEDIESLSRVLSLADAGLLNLNLSPSPLFPFTEEGMEKAFKTQDFIYAHRRVVFDIGRIPAGDQSNAEC